MGADVSAPHQHLLLFPLRFATLSAEIGALVRLSVGALYATPSEAGIREDRACLSQVPTSDTRHPRAPWKALVGNMIGRR